MGRKVLHGEIIKDFVLFLNSVSDRFVLKGGTSLVLCYGLTRFSEDIDLDGFDKDSFYRVVGDFIKEYSSKYKCLYCRIVEDSGTLKRVLIHYGGEKPLKVEVSYRGKVYPQYNICSIKGILVYNIESLMCLKINAFSGRDKLRDLYDIVFIYLNYKKSLSSGTIFSLKNAICYKGVDYVDYLLKTQKDDLIDSNVLADCFMKMYYDLGLV